jgi:hypothetical protein
VKLRYGVRIHGTRRRRNWWFLMMHHTAGTSNALVTHLDDGLRTGRRNARFRLWEGYSCKRLLMEMFIFFVTGCIQIDFFLDAWVQLFCVAQ